MTGDRRERPTFREQVRAVKRLTLGPPLRSVGARRVVAFLVFAFVAAGTAIPLLLRKPLLVELEIAGGACLAILAATLTVLLYRGSNVDPGSAEIVPDGLQAYLPRFHWVGRALETVTEVDDPEGCLVALAVILGGALLILLACLLAWLLVELVIPVLVAFLYLLLRRALMRVTQLSPRTEGRLLPSLGWGTGLALLYGGWLVGIVAAVHGVVALR
jgi:hypothetical protein